MLDLASTLKIFVAVVPETPTGLSECPSLCILLTYGLRLDVSTSMRYHKFPTTALYRPYTERKRWKIPYTTLIDYSGTKDTFRKSQRQALACRFTCFHILCVPLSTWR